MRSRICPPRAGVRITCRNRCRCAWRDGLTPAWVSCGSRRADWGRVIVDDAHQGLVSFYDPERFFGDPRLHRTLLWVLFLWLVFVLGPQRLRAVPDRWRRVDETALIEASGRFYTQAVDPLDAQRALFRNFFNL